MKTIFQCDNSTEGIFTAIYEAYKCRIPRKDIEIQAEQGGNLELFSEYKEIETDLNKAQKVADTIKKRFGKENAEFFYHASLSKEVDKANAIFRTMEKGFRLKNERKIMQDLADPYVIRVFELARNVTNEQHHYYGFVRFRELKNGVLFSKISPQNDVLVLLADHFSDRLPMDSFVLYDEQRKAFILHPKNEKYILVKGETLDEKYISNISEKEADFQNWWKGFYSSVSIKERENTALQKQNLPLRFRRNMVEF